MDVSDMREWVQERLGEVGADLARFVRAARVRQPVDLGVILQAAVIEAQLVSLLAQLDACERYQEHVRRGGTV